VEHVTIITDKFESNRKADRLIIVSRVIKISYMYVIRLREPNHILEYKLVCKQRVTYPLWVTGRRLRVNFGCQL
jgi:hypothetical protein